MSSLGDGDSQEPWGVDDKFSHNYRIGDNVIIEKKFTTIIEILTNVDSGYRVNPGVDGVSYWNEDAMKVAPTIGQVWQDRDKRNLSGNRYLHVDAISYQQGKTVAECSQVFRSESPFKFIKHQTNRKFKVRVEQMLKRFRLVQQYEESTP